MKAPLVTRTVKHPDDHVVMNPYLTRWLEMTPADRRQPIFIEDRVRRTWR